MRRFGALVVIALLVAAFAIPAAIATENPDAQTTDSMTINAKAIDDHECNDSESHWVINQIDSEEFAPDSILVTYSDGTTEIIELLKFTGGVAHYTTTNNLDKTPTAATAEIYLGWSGQFNLSHGPCGNETTTTTEQETTTTTEQETTTTTEQETTTTTEQETTTTTEQETTTTTEQETTTTTVADTTSTTAVVQATTTVVTDSTLPFTGPSDYVKPLGLLGLVSIVIGMTLLALRGRKEEDIIQDMPKYLLN